MYNDRETSRRYGRRSGITTSKRRCSPLGQLLQGTNQTSLRANHQSLTQQKGMKMCQTAVGLCESEGNPQMKISLQNTFQASVSGVGSGTNTPMNPVEPGKEDEFVILSAKPTNPAGLEAELAKYK